MCWRPSACTATTPPCRCWPGAGPNRPALDLCPRRPPLRAAAPRPPRCSSSRRDRREDHPQPHLAGWQRHPAGRRLWRLQRPLPARPRSGAGDRARCAGAMPGASSSNSPTSPATSARADRRRRDLAARAGGRQAHRRALRHRARRSTASTPTPVWRSGSAAVAPAGRRPARLDPSPSAPGLSSTLPSPRRSTTCSRKAAGRLHPLPRRRPHLPHQQRRRAQPCAESPSAERAGSSPAPSVAATARPSCIP